MAPLYGYEFFGGFYPLGGSGRIADVLATVLLQRRGTLLVNTEVDQIIVEQGKAAAIRLADGRRIKAASVISNADFKKTFLDLIEPKHLPADFLALVRGARPSCSAFTVSLGLDFIPELPPICSITPETGRGFGLTMPSLVDSSAAPAGYATLQIVKLIPNAEARIWLAAPPDEEHRRRRAFGDQLIAQAEAVIPNLKSHIVFRSDASPVTFAHYGGSSEGAIYGVEKRVRLKGNKSPIPGLFIAGGSHIVGTEGVFISGAMAAEALLPGLLSAPRPEYEEQGDLITMQQKVEAR